ncbi:hypothetical protein FMUND_12811 [Fusarium mundagurra]|uniref:Uncharacterized protein n=1 Tax=Fusarium mundagurra TaxID=1567541 RepID=A0A8H5Y1E0_9HYPO|nr:hypothetical protein FMUND_12811 [Fusarium mundagurra]
MASSASTPQAKQPTDPIDKDRDLQWRSAPASHTTSHCHKVSLDTMSKPSVATRNDGETGWDSMVTALRSLVPAIPMFVMLFLLTVQPSK